VTRFLLTFQYHAHWNINAVLKIKYRDNHQCDSAGSNIYVAV